MSNKLREALENLICTAELLWGEVKPVRDSDTMKVTHPIIEEAKSALSEKEDGWIDKKPTEWKECILIAASWFGDHWEYTSFTIEKTTFEDIWYWGIFKDGDEWGDIADLKADKYLILDPLPQPPAQELK